MTSMITTAVALMAGLMMTRLFKLLRMSFPDVTAFLLAGLLVGPYGIGRLGVEGLGFPSYQEIADLSSLSNAALGFIAFSIGNEFKMEDLRHTGRAAAVIGILQAMAATLVTDVVLLILHLLLGPEILPVPVCIVLGAIASATAPAATLMVVRQYKADGPLTRLLLPIVALDDAVGLVIFAVSMGVARAMIGGTPDLAGIVEEPLLEIACSLMFGALMGTIMSKLEQLFYSNSNRLAMTISFVVLTIALSSLRVHAGRLEFGFSSLLVCMMMGTVFCNVSSFAEDIFTRCDKWTVPLYCVFFVISGAQLDLGVFLQPAMVLIGVFYILSRCAGKYLGARESCRLMGQSAIVTQYLGITLFPQAGVALGMVVTASSLGAEEGTVIRNVILFSVLFYELVGPSMTKWALTRAGEITPTPAQKKDRSRFKAGRATV